jgi:RNA 2',3'-cyclic 3'-phosphodiesterase
MENIRSFIAVEVDPAARAWLEGWLARLRERYGPIRWVKEKNLHITLRFLGDIPVNRIEQVSAILAARALSVPPLRLDFGAPGTFGPRRSPRTFWLGIVPGPALDALAAFQSKVEGDLVRAGFSREDRPFSPHLTIGRNPGSISTEGWEATLPPWPGGGTAGFDARSAVLFRSDLKPQGPDYTVLSEATFAAPRAATEVRP